VKIIDDVISRIEELDRSSSGVFLAHALASACHDHYKVSLLDASVKLDQTSMRLVSNLMLMVHEPDFSNADQSNAMAYLRENGYLD
tara:strand:+ start:12645 stop:12902 length:258 start_codon:yes stop_codon:yes gene_type:complete